MDNEKIVEKFYQEFFNDHDLSAADKYVKSNYVQHNPGVTQGRRGLVEGFRERFEVDPNFHLVIKDIIAKDNKVWVYSKNVDPEGNTQVRVVDIYRIEDGQLAEHWDVLQGQ